MFTHKVANLFDKFKQTSKWQKLPNMQKGLMLKTLEEAKNSEKLAEEFYNFLEDLINQKPKLILKSRK